MKWGGGGGGGSRAKYYGTGITIIKTKHRHFNMMVEKLCSEYTKRKSKTSVALLNKIANQVHFYGAQ